MAKQKKKSTQINSMDKAIGRMAGIEVQNPSEFRKYMDELKERYKEYAENIGLQGNPSEIPKITKENEHYFHQICSTATMNEYISFVRTLLIGYWTSHRKVYVFTQEIIDYMETVLRIQDFTIDITALQKVALREPIYIEAPPGSPVSRVFWGAVSFCHKDMVERYNKGLADEYCCFVSLISDKGCFAAFNMNGRSSVREAVERWRDDDEKAKEEMIFALKLVAYIGYMRGMKDATDLAFTEEPIRNGVRYRTQTIYTDSVLPDETKPRGWIQAGLAPVIGYFDRKNMLRDFQNESSQHPDQIVVRNGDGDNAATFLQRMVLSWESRRNFYSFTSETAIFVASDNVYGLIKEGISSELLDYMPYNVIALIPEDPVSFSAALIARCTVEGNQPGVFVSIIGQENCPEAFCFPEDAPLMNGNIDRCLKEVRGDILLSLGLFKHILQTLKRKTIRRIGNREESKARPPHPVTEADIPASPVVRQGTDIDNIVPIAMFDLTKRTVKKVSQKEAAHRNGWKVVPHVRRRHPHRYWVGKGKDKHLEVRWLESMAINRKQKELPSVTVHNVGL